MKMTHSRQKHKSPALWHLLPINREKSISASGGILYWPQAHLDWVRPGIILYGVSPKSGTEAGDYGLKPVMTLKSRLIAVRKHKTGKRSVTAVPGSVIVTPAGVIAVGYGDGYPRSAPSGTPVVINGRRVPIAGRVSMDMITIDRGRIAVIKRVMKSFYGGFTAGGANCRSQWYQCL